MVRYIDDVFGVYAVSDDAEERQVSEYFEKVVPPHTGAQCGACFRLTTVLRADGKHCWGQLQLSSMEPCGPSPEREWTAAVMNAKCRWRHCQEGLSLLVGVVYTQYSC